MRKKHDSHELGISIVTLNLEVLRFSNFPVNSATLRSPLSFTFPRLNSFKAEVSGHLTKWLALKLREGINALLWNPYQCPNMESLSDKKDLAAYLVASELLHGAGKEGVASLRHRDVGHVLREPRKKSYHVLAAAWSGDKRDRLNGGADKDKYVE